MYDPKGDVGAIVSALRQPAGVQVAGDVTRLPAMPDRTAPIHQPIATDYAWGLKNHPQVHSIGEERMIDWLRRAGERNNMQFNRPVAVPPFNQWPGSGGTGGNLPPKM